MKENSLWYYISPWYFKKD